MFLSSHPRKSEKLQMKQKNSDMFLLLTTYLIDGELIHDFLAHILIVKPKKGQSLKRKALEKN